MQSLQCSGSVGPMHPSRPVGRLYCLHMLQCRIWRNTVYHSVKSTEPTADTDAAAYVMGIAQFPTGLTEVIRLGPVFKSEQSEESFCPPKIETILLVWAV